MAGAGSVACAEVRLGAEIGSERSLHPEAPPRLLLEPPRAAGATVTLSGDLHAQSKVAANGRSTAHGFTTYRLPLPVIL